MRIEGLDARQAHWSLRPFYYLMRRMFGRVLTPYTVYAHRPSMLWSFTILTLALDRSKVVEAKLKSLVSIRAAQMIGCPF